jgi:hypothetical protein
MAKPNYQFEKRRKEMIKKAKKAEKLRLKAESGNNPVDDTAGADAYLDKPEAEEASAESPAENPAA